MPNLMCIHCYISGTVQGVWFRASTKEEADKLSLTGWVRNLADGRVEVMACGEKAMVERLNTWLKKGPPHAKVTEYNCEELPWHEYKGFKVL